MRFLVLVAALMASPSVALSVTKVHQERMIATPARENARRSLLGSIASATSALLLTQPAMAQDEVEWNVFNGLIFNYRGGGFNGLDASTLDEPSVPFLEFGSRLQKGQVAFVELYAPDGDVAYATFKSEDGKLEKPIRIGQGFPIEQHDGYSSPAFVVRALKNYNVPYKFTVPGLEQYK
jgi:hypothetical protein